MFQPCYFRPLAMLCLPLSIICLVACGGGSSSSSGLGDPPAVQNASPLQGVDLSGALALVITDGSGALKPSSALGNDLKAKNDKFDQAFDPETLYKVTADGGIVPVELTSESGESLRGSIVPLHVQDLGRGWSLITFRQRYQFVVKELDPAGREEFRVTSIFFNQAYLVNSESGSAYEANWAAQTLIREDGGKGYYDRTQGEGVVRIGGSGGMRRFEDSGRYGFDDVGRLYVIGSIGFQDDQGGWSWGQRVLMVDTDREDASVLTATVIQSVDLDAELLGGLAVSGDGELLAYQFNVVPGDWRVMNLSDGSNWSANIIAGTAGAKVMRGADGILYVICQRSINFPQWDEGGLAINYSAVDQLSRNEGESRPVSTFVAMLHDPREVPTRDWPAELAALQELQGEDPEGEPDSDERSAWLSDFSDRIFEHSQYVSPSASQYDKLAFTNLSHVVSGRFLRSNYVLDVIVDINFSNGRMVDYTMYDFGLSQIRDFTISEESIYYFGVDSILGSDRIIRWTPSALFSDTVSEIGIDVESLDVQRFRVLGPDTILFEAVVLNPFDELQTGDRILAEADFAGLVTVLDIIGVGEPQIIVMERVRMGSFIIVDGSPDDWPVSLRVLSDPAGDHVNSQDGDLRYLSTTADSTYRWYLVEAENTFGETFVIIELSPSQVLEVSPDSVFSWVVGGEDQEFLAVGGIGARSGGIVEIRLPLSNLDEPFELPLIRTEVERVFGEAEVVGNNINAEEQMLELVLSLPTPVGPDAVLIALDNERQILVSDTAFDGQQIGPIAEPVDYQVILRDMSASPSPDVVVSDQMGGVQWIEGDLLLNVSLLDLGLAEPFPSGISASVISDTQILGLLVDEFAIVEDG